MEDSKEKKAYLVQVSGDSWESEWSTNLFVTCDEPKAKAYVDRANNLLNEYMEFLVEKTVGFKGYLNPDTTDNVSEWKRKLTDIEVSSPMCYYEEITVR